MGIAIGNAIGVPFLKSALGVPASLSVSVLSSTSAKLTWTNSGNQGNGIRVYSSTDGINYSQVGSDLPVGTTSYTHNSINTGSDRYWYVVYFKGTKEGTPSSVVQLDWFTIQCTTTGAQTLTLNRVDCVAGDGITIFWGDGSSNSYTSANNNNTKTHAYSGAGTWTVKIANPLNISYIDIRDQKLTNFNSSQFLKCGDNLIGIYLDTLGTGIVINSSDLAHLKLSNQLYLYFTQSGTYTINSDHFKNYTLSNQLILRFSQSGTYTINSDHFKNYTLSNQLILRFTQSGTYTINSDHFKNYTLSGQLYLDFPQSGTYTINSDHFKNYTLSYQLTLYFPQTGTYTINSDHFKNYTVNNEYRLIFNTTNLTKTISRSDFTLYRIASVTITMGLTQAEVDAILLGFYDAFPLKTNTGGTINLNGAGNEAPSGTYTAQCPPTTGKNAAYELLNDSCNASDKHWATINVVGGL